MPLPEHSERPGCLYREVVGEGWELVAARVRQLHESGERREYHGRLCVRHGKSAIAKLLARLMKMPPEDADCSTLLTVTRIPGQERWDRRFRDHRLVSTQSADSKGRLIEQFGPLILRFVVTRKESGLRFQHVGSGFKVGRLEAPIPLWLGPRIAAVEMESGDGRLVHVHVEVFAPIVGRITSYGGTIGPAEDRDCT